MSIPSLATEAAASNGYPSRRFGQRERQLLASVKAYVDSLSPDTVITTQGDIIVGDSDGDAARLAKGASGLPLVAGASTVSYAELTGAGIADDAVSLEHLDSGIEYTHRVFAAGEFTTVGGDATESITVAGALATDLAFVVLKTPGVSPETIISSAAGIGAITVVFSADPSTDHVVTYQLLRAAS